MNKKLIVFGGAFNPPTKAHFEIAKMATEQLGADKLIFVPVGNKYEKNDLIDGQSRMEMLDLIVKGHDEMCVSSVEVNSDKHMTTIDTLSEMQLQYPDYDLYFLMGADNLSYFNTWNNSEDILMKYNLLVVDREGYSVEDIISNDTLLTKYKNKVTDIELGELRLISSTNVRKLVNSGADGILEYIDKYVHEYIKTNGIYIEEVS